MKKKNIILCIAIAICLIACIFVLLVKVFEINLIKHDSIQTGGFNVKYYGTFDGVKLVKIYDGVIRRGTFELTVDKELTDKSNENPPYLKDINLDGHEDFLIPHSKDKNGDLRYAAFIWNNEIKMFEASELLGDIANMSMDEVDVLHSSMTIYNVVFPGGHNVPEEYEEHHITAQYKLVNGKFQPLREYDLIYYSESDIYCYSKKDYNPENGELVEFEEDWMTPEEAEELK